MESFNILRPGMISALCKQQWYVCIWGNPVTSEHAFNPLFESCIPKLISSVIADGITKTKRIHLVRFHIVFYLHHKHSLVIVCLFCVTAFDTVLFCFLYLLSYSS